MNKIKCPHCGESLDIQESMQHEIDEALKAKDLDQQKAIDEALKAKDLDQQKAIDEAVKAKDLDQQKAIDEAVKAKEKAIDEAVKAKELVDKEEKLAKTQKENEILELQNKHNIEKQTLILQAQEKENQLNAKLNEMGSGISSSGQLRGEVGENYVKEKLEHYFKHDLLREVPKGQKGVDWILDVNAKRGQKIASIYIEVKNTNAYMKSWVKKLRQNMQDDGIQCGVLITKTFPAEHKGKTQFFPPNTKEIIVCGLDETQFFVPIALLRNKLIEMNTMLNVDKAGRTEIPQLIFEYITGTQFNDAVKNIFTALAEKKQKQVIRKATFNRIIREDQAYIDEIEASLIEALGGIKLLSPKSNIGLPEEDTELDDE